MKPNVRNGLALAAGAVRRCESGTVVWQPGVFSIHSINACVRVSESQAMRGTRRTGARDAHSLRHAVQLHLRGRRHAAGGVNRAQTRKRHSLKGLLSLKSEHHIDRLCSDVSRS
jgi:hypothetical protein